MKQDNDLKIEYCGFTRECNIFDKYVNENINAMKKFYGTALSENIQNSIKKELLHSDVLEILKDINVFDKLIFCGGTSLRRVYKSVRLSEDLDFKSNADFDINELNDFKSICSKYLKDKYGLNVKIDYKDREGTNTSAINVDLIMSSNKHIPHEKIHIDIEKTVALTKHKGIFHYIYPTEFSKNEDEQGIPINVESKEELLVDKILALSLRTYIKGRDVYDIYWLLEDGISFDNKLFEECIKVKKFQNRTINREWGVDLFKERVKKCNENIIKESIHNELQRFLPPSYLSHFFTMYSSFLEKLEELELSPAPYQR